MTENSKKYDAMIKACNISKEELIETGQMKGFMGIYNLGLENMYDYLIKNSEVRKHGSWFLLDECANEGVYCSVCHKKVYKTDYANQKVKSKYCPNCGAIMDLSRRMYWIWYSLYHSVHSTRHNAESSFTCIRYKWQ